MEWAKRRNCTGSRARATFLRRLESRPRPAAASPRRTANSRAPTGAAGVRLALEFQASAAFANNLHTAAAVVAECGSPRLGLCLDAFHDHAGPSKPDAQANRSHGHLFHVQFCDMTCVGAGVALGDGVEADPGLYGGPSRSVGVAADAGNVSHVHETRVRVVNRGKTQRGHVSDCARAHGHDEADDASDAGRRTLIGLDV